MQIHQMVKDIMEKHKQKIEITQWAIISAISSLIYSEYIAKMIQRQVPTKLIFVPTIRSVEEILSHDGYLMNLLSERIIDEIIKNELFIKYKDAPELEIFKEENIEILKTVFDLYMIPNISKTIPDVISRKFDLRNPDQQIFRENRDIDLFGRNPINEGQFKYIVDQTVLQLLIILPTIKKDVEFSENNMDICVADNEIITIDNSNAICPIHFDKSIIENDDVIKLLLFVTSSTIETCDWNENAICKGPNKNIVEYLLRTSAFNQVALTTLGDIVVKNNE